MEPYDDLYFEEVGDEIYDDFIEDEELERFNDFRNIFAQMEIERKENSSESGLPSATSPDDIDQRISSLAENACLTWDPRSGISKEIYCRIYEDIYDNLEENLRNDAFEAYGKQILALSKELTKANQRLDEEISKSNKRIDEVVWQMRRKDAEFR